MGHGSESGRHSGSVLPAGGIHDPSAEGRTGQVSTPDSTRTRARQLVLESTDGQRRMCIILFNNMHEVNSSEGYISRILWYSYWLHNTTSAGNSIFSQYYIRRNKYIM